MDVITACPCAGNPHPAGDTVTLRDKPTFHMGATALGWAGKGVEGGPTTGDILELYVREGILSWTFLEDDGSPKPVTDETLDWFLDDYTLAYPIAEKASDLYTELVFAPLVAQVRKASPPRAARRSRSSNSGQTSPST